MEGNLIILAGGASSRMKGLIGSDSLSKDEKYQADNRSKCLISIDKNGRPLMDYLLYNAAMAGYKNIYIITSKDNQLFKSFYGNKRNDNNFKGLKINYAIQYISSNREKPLGTADALYQVMKQYPELKTTSFTVCNSDNLYSIKALKLLKESISANNALISYDRDSLKFSEDRIVKFALMLFNEDQFLEDIVEKPPMDTLSKYVDVNGKVRVSMNIFKFNGNMFFKYLENCPLHPQRGEKELPTSLLNMVKDHPNSTIGIPLSEHVPDLTSKGDISVLKNYVKNINLSDW